MDLQVTQSCAFPAPLISFHLSLQVPCFLLLTDQNLCLSASVDLVASLLLEESYYQDNNRNILEKCPYRMCVEACFCSRSRSSFHLALFWPDSRQPSCLLSKKKSQYSQCCVIFERYFVLVLSDSWVTSLLSDKLFSSLNANITKPGDRSFCCILNKMMAVLNYGWWTEDTRMLIQFLLFYRIKWFTFFKF